MVSTVISAGRGPQPAHQTLRPRHAGLLTGSLFPSKRRSELDFQALVAVAVGVQGDAPWRAAARLLHHVHELDGGAALPDDAQEGERGVRVPHPREGCK